jgi:hypothetical protein
VRQVSWCDPAGGSPAELCGRLGDEVDQAAL